MTQPLFAICGSGFGLYGYLPALTVWGRKVVLPRSYAPRVYERPELAGLEQNIVWAPDIDGALAASAGVIVALPPQQQAVVLERCLALPNIKSILLEKPLAADSASAVIALEKLEKSRKRFEIGYSFLHTSWLKSLHPELIASDHVSIEWHFMAHHFANNVSTWKRRHSQGGGVLRFYGIHLLAVLAYWGYDTVQNSSIYERVADEPETWNCAVVGPGLPPCRIHIDSRNSSPRFSVTTAQGGGLVDLVEPFGLEEPAAPFDARVPALVSLLRQFDSGKPALDEIYNRTNQLWLETERVSPTPSGVAGDQSI